MWSPPKLSGLIPMSIDYNDYQKNNWRRFFFAVLIGFSVVLLSNSLFWGLITACFAGLIWEMFE